MQALARGRIDCAPVHEMLLYNRQQLLETLVEQQAQHDRTLTQRTTKELPNGLAVISCGSLSLPTPLP